MIALGGAIGTGLFFGLAKTIHLTGPSIILAYLIGGVIIYIISAALGEMTIHNPSSGAFSEYARIYLGNFAGFLSGWSAWFEYCIVCMVELTAVALFSEFIYPNSLHWLICLSVLIVFTIINLLNVKIFGEFEFWFASVKVIAIIFMIVFSLYLIIFNHALNPEFTNYFSLKTFFSGGLTGFLDSFVIIVFSFGGTEFISIAAAEVKNPAQSVPKAINQVVFRILMFYVLTVTCVLALYPYNLLSPEISPFVDVYQKVGLKSAAYIMNIVAITAALSSFNSSLYSSSRILYNLANNGFAPKFLSKVNTHTHIPYYAVFITSSFVILAAVINYFFPKKAIMLLIAIATTSILIVWFIILATHMKFKSKNKLICSKTKVKGKMSNFKLLFAPYSNIIAMVFLLIIIVMMTTIADMHLSLYIAPCWILLILAIYVLV